MKKQLIFTLCCIALSTALMAGCVKSTVSNSDSAEQAALTTDAPEKAIEYYEECVTLPKADSCVEISQKSSSTSKKMDGTITAITYKYSDSDGNTQTLMKEYVDYLSANGFSAMEIGSTEYDIIEGDVKIATVTLDSDMMVVDIIPEADRTPSQSNTPAIALGQTVSTGDYEFTLDNVELSYEVMPEDTSSVYTSYPAESGKVYLHIDGKVKNLMKRDIRIEELFSPSVTYGDGYQYAGFTIVDTGNSFDWVSSYTAAAPLETSHVHGLVELPEDVADSTDSLTAFLKMSDGTAYQYVFRAGE